MVTAVTLASHGVGGEVMEGMAAMAVVQGPAVRAANLVLAIPAQAVMAGQADLAAILGEAVMVEKAYPLE